ncbi:hypothetical protein tf_59 [Pseudomonas phage tf]|jgi:hypothetical protein|uniref:Uncharacterized protein n=1 Tax=Pseudomonas phage tf TaxID=1114179 RepID=I2FLS8_9CAUD|nr:hypothetical protein tf_59 [Pseudomonas phage tf]CCE60812.1 hypothetical protein tf_59 [Pseudomonas phage tf]
MDSLINGIGLPLLVSVAISLGGQYVQSSTDSTLLKENIAATKSLTEAVIQLRTDMAVVKDRQERTDGR